MRRSLLIDAQALYMVPTPAALAIKFAQKMRQRGTPVRASDEVLVARVDHGRWLADCPACNAGIALTPGVAEAFCFGAGCAHHFTNIVWPSDEAIDEIERTLRARPKVPTRNWWPTETVHALRAENRAHGLPERHELTHERQARELTPVKGGRP